MGLRVLLVAALAAATLGACRARDNDPGPGGVTVGEARALDEAAAMLENRPQAPPLIPAETATAAPRATAPHKAAAKH